ncbi:Hsp70 family protein [Frigidibacter sp. MR17.14]|uniref:Hsp70 family protein n=1 Tax=Frigidibacter sp. MR17.14 TaxID=3126509 RepID=UPI003013086E
MSQPALSSACGIDFGTSNSTVGLVEQGRARLIALEGDQPTLPSALFWDEEGGPPLFGRAAVAAYVSGEDGRLMRSLKSTLGTGLIRESTRIGRRAVPFAEVISRFFGHLRARLDAEAGQRLTRAVLGRPVHFVDDDPEGDAAAEAALARIAKDQGFDEVSFQFEPLAAALSYEATLAREELVLIVDIGGGTSDFSLIRLSPERARAADRAADILGNDGIRVGGTDFDRQFSMAEVMPELGMDSTTGGGRGRMPRHYYVDLATWVRINMAYSQRNETDIKALLKEADAPEKVARLLRVIETRAGHALAMATEAAKIRLTADEATRLELHALTGGPNPVVTRPRLEAALEAPLARISERIGTVLAQAGLQAGAIDTVFLTGGAAQLPALARAVGSALPDTRLATGDMLGSVGTGLAIEAARRYG